MNKIFWGLIFMFFSFTFTINEAIVFDFLPNFVGYLLIESGFNALSYTDSAFRKPTPSFLLTVFAIYNIVTFSHFITLPDISSICYLLTMLFIYQAVRDSEQTTNELHANTLRNSLISYVVTLVLLVIATLVLLSTFSDIFAVLSGILTISNIAIAIWYTIAFHQTKKLYAQRELTLAAQQKSTIAAENSTDSI